VGQAPPLLEPSRQPNLRGRVSRPREVEIVVPREAEQEQAALLEQLERQQQQEQQQEHSGSNSSRLLDHQPSRGRTPPPVLRVKAGTPLQ